MTGPAAGLFPLYLNPTTNAFTSHKARDALTMTALQRGMVCESADARDTAAAAGILRSDGRLFLW